MAETALSWTTSFLSLRQFVDDRYGPGSFARLRLVLQEQHDIVLPSPLVGDGWLPTAHLLAALHAGRALFADEDFHARFGWAAAEYELSWVQRMALRFTSPQFFLERGALLWRSRHNTGTWTAEGRPHFIRGTLRDFAVVDSLFCEVLRQWLTRACVMTGAGKAYVVERQCRARGADACVFEGSW